MSKKHSAAAKARAEARLANITDPDAAGSGKARTRVSKSGKKKAIGPPIEGLPLAEVVEAPEPKVSPRGLYQVLVTVGGHSYQFKQRAVDEAEAICRVFDKHESLKALANQCKYRVTKIEDAPVANVPADGVLERTTMPGHTVTEPKVPEPAPEAKKASDRVATPHAK